MDFQNVKSLLANADALFYVRLVMGWMLIPVALISASKVNWLYVFSGIHLLYGLFNFFANGLLKSFLQPVVFTFISLAIILWHKKLASKSEFVSELTDV